MRQSRALHKTRIKCEELRKIHTLLWKKGQPISMIHVVLVKREEQRAQENQELMVLVKELT